MPEDTSLDAFDSDESDDADSAESASETDTSPATGPVSDTDELGSDPVDPAVSTFDWSPEGGECADCGGSAERRWRAEGERGGALVCADCKDW